jgi:hypothetical protein
MESADSRNTSLRRRAESRAASGAQFGRVEATVAPPDPAFEFMGDAQPATTRLANRRLGRVLMV